MKNFPFVQSLAISALLLLSLSSCKKEQEDTDTGSAADNALAEATFNDVSNISDEAATGALTNFKSTQASGTLSACATITYDTAASPHVLTIDFGTVNCLCSDGRNRRGKIIVTHTGRYRDPGTTLTTTFDNYFVNDNQVGGSRTVTNEGNNGSGNPYFSVDINGSIILANGGGTITWVSTRTREWIVGDDTPAWNDDIYLITGSATGTNAAGGTFSSTITTPLRKEVGCRNLVSGTIEFTPAGKPLRIIDFGTGACDNTATVTINGHTYTVTLP